MVATWEINYNGLSAGNNRTHQVNTIEGFAMPEIAEEVNLGGKHGGYVWAEFASERRWIIEGVSYTEVAESDSVIETRVSELRAAFVPRQTPIALTVTTPSGAQYISYAKPTRLDFMLNREYSIGWVPWTVELVAPDPRLYGTVLKSQVIANGATQSITNAGTFPTYPTVTFNANVTNLSIKHVGKNQFVVTLSASPAMTAPVTVDFAERTLTDGTGTSRYELISQQSTEWWTIDPGAQSISNLGLSGSLTMTWRDAWL